MKKFFFLFFTSLILSLTGFAQFPQCLMPGNVFGKVDDDTLLNTRRVMLNSRIKKIYAHQTYRESLKTYKTTMINKSGAIESVTTCLSKDEKIDSWCAFDTILYDGTSRISEIKSRDNYGNEISKRVLEYIGENELKLTSINNIEGKQGDTLIDYRYFNKKGQMIKLIQIIKDRQSETSLYYYNADGLLDSVQYGNSLLPTIIYKRNEKKRKKIIETQIQYSSYKWVYNRSGQCTSVEITSTYPPASNYDDIIKSKIKYHYNRDGTLSKVSSIRNNIVKAMMYYTYSK